MAKFVCDSCGKVTSQIVLKLWKLPRDGRRADHSEYTHYANIGVCCVLDVNKIAWQPRREYKKKVTTSEEVAE